MVVLIMAVLFLLDNLWTVKVSASFIGCFGNLSLGKIVIGPVVNGAVKTFLIVIIGMVSVYWLRVSAPINEMIDNKLKLKKLKK